jgi:hypothetical protein
MVQCMTRRTKGEEVAQLIRATLGNFDDVMNIKR